jgi:L-ascorbate metabolism protein UlaG (beta-lactamase superfamily)
MTRKILMELTWVEGSNSWFRIRAGGKIIHIDPSYSPKGHAPGPELNDKADLVLVTHAHGDHFQKGTVSALAGDSTIIIAPSKVAGRSGQLRNVVVTEPGKEHDLGWVKLKAVYAYNLGLKGHIFHKKGKCVGYLLTIEGRTIYHAGDTDLIPEMRQLGHVDLALLPIGGTFTMDVEAAAEAARAIGAPIVVPMHNLRTPIAELKARLAEAPSIQVMLAEHGSPFEPF